MKTPVADLEGGAAGMPPPPSPHLTFDWLYFCIPFCIRMLKNKAQLAWDSNLSKLDPSRIRDFMLVMCVGAYNLLHPPPPPPPPPPKSKSWIRPWTPLTFTSFKCTGNMCLGRRGRELGWVDAAITFWSNTCPSRAHGIWQHISYLFWMFRSGLLSCCRILPWFPQTLAGGAVQDGVRDLCPAGGVWRSFYRPGSRGLEGRRNLRRRWETCPGLSWFMFNPSDLISTAPQALPILAHENWTPTTSNCTRLSFHSFLFHISSHVLLLSFSKLLLPGCVISHSSFSCLYQLFKKESCSDNMAVLPWKPTSIVSYNFTKNYWH